MCGEYLVPCPRLCGQATTAREEGAVVTRERRPYHLYPLLGLVLVAAMGIGLYYRVKHRQQSGGAAGS
jgi:hypothetical protein